MPQILVLADINRAEFIGLQNTPFKSAKLTGLLLLIINKCMQGRLRQDSTKINHPNPFEHQKYELLLMKMVEKDVLFWKAATRRTAQVLVGLLLMMAVFFISAGRTYLPRARAFLGLYFVSLLLNMVIFLKSNPEIIRTRSEIIGEMKWWDKIFAMFYTVFILTMFIICGLDVGRFNISSTVVEFLAVGIIFFTVGRMFVVWSMVENKFFETTVRIKNEKDQRVVSIEPYAIVQHPSYVGMILSYGCAPFIIGFFKG